MAFYVYKHNVQVLFLYFVCSLETKVYICGMKGKSKEVILSETGKFLIDIAKLVFGGVILAGIMKYENINPWLLFSIGGSVVLICFLSGLILTALSKRKEV